MTKIQVDNPIVELDGDEASRLVWAFIKEKLILPYLDLKIEYYDLGLANRDRTDDLITLQAAEAIQKHGVGIKCSTITPSLALTQELGLKRAYKSPNATLRNQIGGTLIREPLVIERLPKPIGHWKKPIVVARHAMADLYQSQEIRFEGPGRLSLRFESETGEVTERQLLQAKEPGVALGQFNLAPSIKAFARASMSKALEMGLPCYFAHKAGVLKEYDGLFLEIFQEVYESEFQSQGLEYEAHSIDDMIAEAIRSEGGFLLACKNYEGDLISEMVAQGFGSLGLMSSTLISEDGQTLIAEAAHGAATRHYHLSPGEEETAINPIASIFAWSKGLAFRGELDETPEVVFFAKSLEEATTECIESGKMTRDLAHLTHGDRMEKKHYLSAQAFLDAVQANLSSKLQG